MARLKSGPADPVLANDQLAALRALYDNWGAELFMSSMFWIRAKEPQTFSGVSVPTSLVPFRFNHVQRHLEANLARNNRVLKARQMGLTTFLLLRRIFLNIITHKGRTGLLISQNNEYAGYHFQIASRVYDHIGEVDPNDDEKNMFSQQLKQHLLHRKLSNKKEVNFDMLDSRIIVASAEVPEAGQGVTLHHILASEVARWPGNPEETLSNIIGALVPGGTKDEECTADGAAGYFYERYIASMDSSKQRDAVPHFYPWWWMDEYDNKNITPEQQDELMNDIQADEIRVIAQIHHDLAGVVWRGAPTA